ncbi:cold-induced thioredoxin domain-containing protein [Cryptococcus neoformans]|nr:cold-induced thioredoxin domain-containing protein [Cryptococcus neoformans var. grubii]OXC57860.1 cold-induced thioredoxin domain-containing protein [Cryptococcus neoformans var. grubii MW-RSA852]
MVVSNCSHIGNSHLPMFRSLSRTLKPIAPFPRHIRPTPHGIYHLRMSSTSATDPTPRLSNVLAKSKSPYLLQHKDNPVAWQEWSPETIALAQKLDKPIFLSSGYSACHWCHVLAHESFEDEETAKMMNEWFVNIKVDREERPDVDRMYMSYLQAVSGGGGWPMSIFMTPKLEPFFAGTYFPRPNFHQLLNKIHEVWKEDREKCEKMGKGVIEALKDMSDTGRTSESLSQLLASSPASKLFAQLSTMNDTRYGGFTNAGSSTRGPKFPSCSITLEPLARLASIPGGGARNAEIREDAREMGMKMLRSMWAGGIRDWVGGGMARYSVDEKWMVPHFEKMLYDQAQLVSSCLDFARLYPANHQDRLLCYDLAADILKYTLRDLKSPEGGFWSAEDADSAEYKGAKKSEGAFYIWKKTEIDEILGDDAPLFDSFFGFEPDGNVNIIHDSHGEMRGKNILHQHKTYEEVALEFGKREDQAKDIIIEACEKLRLKREERERPGLDDKILTAWNGLMVRQLCILYMLLHKSPQLTVPQLTALSKASTLLPSSYGISSQCLPAALGIVNFVKSHMWDPSTRTLTRSYREGKGPQAQTDDYAFLIQGLLNLYEATGDESHVLFAEELQKRQDELFWDDDDGGYFASAEDAHVLVRMKDAQDGAEPSAAAVSAHNLSRFSLLLSSEFENYEARAEATFLSMGPLITQAPRAVGYAVSGLIDLEKGYREVIVIGSANDEMIKEFLKVARETYFSNQVIVHIQPEKLPKGLAEKNEVVKALINDVESGKEKEASLRVCEGGTCGLPVKDLEGGKNLLKDV